MGGDRLVLDDSEVVLIHLKRIAGKNQYYNCSPSALIAGNPCLCFALKRE